MKQLILTAALLTLAAPAFAIHCPADMAKIDAALAAGTTLSEADLAKVRTWRRQGERLHKAGDHGASVIELKKAMGKLGIE